MAEFVVVIAVEDHVSSVLKAIGDWQLKIPADAALPRLPEDLVIISTGEQRSAVKIIMRPSPALLGWLAEVRKLSVQ